MAEQDDDERGPRERIYDEEFAPLVGRLIELSKRHRIPMVASFELDDDEDNGPMLCTTAILEKGDDERLWKARRAIYPEPQFAAFTIFTKAPTEGEGRHG
jgi:hypothetical protein